MSRHYYNLQYLLRTDVREATLTDQDLGADCAHHARMFFDRPDYDLPSAITGPLSLSPTHTMARALEKDYANTTALIFEPAPAFEEILAPIKKIEMAANAADPD